MYSFFNKELLYRAFSVIIFIPIAIIPLFFSKYLSVIIYLLFASIIIDELNRIKKNLSKNILFYKIYIIIAVSSFLLFLFLLITEYVPVFLLLSIIIVIWSFDTFSYVGGKLIGGKKLIPHISSGKTISGLISGILMAIIISKVIFDCIGVDKEFSLAYVILIITIAFAGDTLVSVFKRLASIKDSGNIMPGHGGLLDRFDSFILVFFIFGIYKLVI